MKRIILHHDVYKDFYILTDSEYNQIGDDYKGRSIKDTSIKCAFLPGCGTTLFFENMHFLVISDREQLEKFAIWKDHKVIGYCEITRKAAEKANAANNAIFYFGFDEVTRPEKYREGIS